MPREPPVMSAALPAREIMTPPKVETRKSKLENRNRPTSAVRDGCAGSLPQCAKQRRCQRIALHSLRMPLYADDPVFVRLVLDRFDYTIGSNRGDAQAAAQIPDGLVMRSIDLHVERVVLIRLARDGGKLSNFSA